jgi:hypothetical protein
MVYISKILLKQSIKIKVAYYHSIRFSSYLSDIFYAIEVI